MRTLIAAIIVIVAGMAVAALAGPFNNLPMVPWTPGGPMLNGGLTGPMVPNAISGGSPPPPTCAGVVDLSVGCALPMLRGF